ncbi:NADH-quinone oxidoreductase subunit M [candidate division GN15 bacterium]|nr:NADH-quinone oxidoreductase subunit M [candidate division GN15 bacterium]
MDWLTPLIFAPLVGAIILAFVPSKQTETIKGVALIIAIITFILSLFVYAQFDKLGAGMQLTVNVPWITSLGIHYHLGIDGISLLLIVLTTVLTILAILSSWRSITEGVKGFFVSMLILTSGMIGVFCALDLFLFYIFWEVMLIPMYFLIGIWGGPRRVYAAIKFVLFTMFGSLLMLVAILYLYFQYHSFAGVYTFDMLKLMQMPIAINPQHWLFVAFALAFAIKVPLWPFHTWLPDAHVQAPTAGSVILAGVLLKMGTYGFIRIAMPMFPDATATFVPYIAILSVIAIIYGALVSMVQKDIKSLVAFSSVSHMGFVMLGLFALNQEAVQGAVIQMINHGISTGALFLLVGMIYERRHTRLIAEFGGLGKVMPVFSAFFMIVMLSSIGLPFTNGFVGEFLILLGAFKANVWYGVFAATGVILAACYMLWMYQRVVFGKVTNPENEKLTDINWRERIILIPLVVLIFFIGIYPTPLFERTEPAVRQVIAHIEQTRQAKQDLERIDERTLALREGAGLSQKVTEKGVTR